MSADPARIAAAVEALARTRGGHRPDQSRLSRCRFRLPYQDRAFRGHG